MIPRARNENMRLNNVMRLIARCVGTWVCWLVVGFPTDTAVVHNSIIECASTHHCLIMYAPVILLQLCQ